MRARRTSPRRLAAAFVRIVLPPLLAIDWNDGGCAGSLDVDGLALSELFAEAIGPALRDVERNVSAAKPSPFDQQQESCEESEENRSLEFLHG